MNSDIRLKISFRDHPKRVKLLRKLGPAGVLALVDLWLWAAESRPDGNLTGLDADDLAIAANWTGSGEELLEALISTGWLDEVNGALLLHGWRKHNAYAADAEKRSEKARKAAMKRWGGDAKPCSEHCSNNGEHDSGNAPSPSPKPSPKPKRKNNGFELPDWIPEKDWKDFEEMRGRLRKPMTDRARELAVEGLEKLRAEGHDPGAVLQQSILRGWQGLFPVKDENPTGGNGNGQSKEEKIEALRDIRRRVKGEQDYSKYREGEG